MNASSSPTDASPSLLTALEALEADTLAGLPALATLADVESLRVRILGKKGELTGILRGLKSVPADERPAVGAQANTIQTRLEAAIAARAQTLKAEALQHQLRAEAVDVTMPGRPVPRGSAHPLTAVTAELLKIFHGLGFTALDDTECPEVETEFYNFDALNFPPDHPARDTQDTFFTTAGPNVVLRSQTSNAQVRYMERHQPPFRIVSPGRVYRNEEVNSRKYVLFHQMEGLVVDPNVRFSDLKGILQELMNRFFGRSLPLRFRNSFFPFTEPSAEVDIQCLFCEGKGCRTCGHRGWLEVLGAGMVDPNVFRSVSYDPDQVNGFAFGLGLERLAMLKYGIDDIRVFFNNDLRVLHQLNLG